MNFYPYIFGASLVTAISVAHPTMVWALEPTQINEIATNITVRIEIDNGANKDLGSGVIIARDDYSYHVLTAKHVVQYLDYGYTIFTPDGDSYVLDNSTIRHIDGIDLAVISFKSDREYKTALIENVAERITPGMPIYVNGFPKAGQEIQGGAQFTSGSLTGINSQHQSGYNLVYSNFTRGGMSGGPVLNAQGKVIGIHGLAEQEVKEQNNCVAEESGEASILPPKVGSTGNDTSGNCQLASNSPEKIDLNLGISIVTFIERASSIRMDRAIDTTIIKIPRRTPTDSNTSENGTACSGVVCQ
ncbi:trypsin-like peptidase domain-containing protein [Waterburya agarophytonicola K14]|uniref:Trypsin-like peptidase domain-containing protein n=1 Tax=Waterburya agarophytonicola KI4 TaxID=2874699 RepID=A0A964FH44_9CYAN|nr:serine protease [Waterburya agarophytonicola]MCC0178781.1 trypsin-like peptidase domain-containing protein [Waterburya agarophytonicola KI4]